MRNVPVDTAAFMANVKATVGVHPVNDQQGQQRTDKNDRPRWRLEVLYDTPGRDGHELVKINFAAAELPDMQAGGELILHGLAVTYWEMDGRSGMTLAADRVGMKPPGSGRQPAAAA
jgi:hypothetical protein